MFTSVTKVNELSEIEVTVGLPNLCLCGCMLGRQRVALPRRVARLYPAYGLYLYGEGLYAQETRALKLTGAPVLFLPGNAGSYKQGKCTRQVSVLAFQLATSKGRKQGR